MDHSQLSPAEVAQLGEELQRMLQAGVPLDLGLKGLVGTGSTQLNSAAQRLSQRLEAGASLAEAFGEEKAIPPTLKSILIAGSRVGHSDEAIQDLVEVSFSLAVIRSAFYRGLIYPFVLLLATGGLCLLCLTFLLPRVIETYELLRIPLPAFLGIWRPLAVTEVLLLLFGLLPIVCLIASNWLPINSMINRWTGWDRVKEDLNASQIAQLLSVLTKFGVPLPEALGIVSQQTRTPKWSQNLQQIQTVVGRGEPLTQDSLQRTGFPPFLAWLIEVGSREGQLPEALADAGRFYRTRGLRRAEFLQRIIPRVLVLVIGGTITSLYGIAVIGTLSHLWTGIGGPFDE